MKKTVVLIALVLISSAVAASESLGERQEICDRYADVAADLWVWATDPAEYITKGRRIVEGAIPGEERRWAEWAYLMVYKFATQYHTEDPEQRKNDYITIGRRLCLEQGQYWFE